ncbi:MAG: DUF4336 domain-containing protein [Devosiaceae bacterium]|nr:DUF4336 domain-containing protein [Devosiaceae bacterium]
MKRLQSIGQDIWLCEGGNVDFYGFAYNTRMIVVRLPDASLWVWSPVAMDDELKSEVEELGGVLTWSAPTKFTICF